MKAQQLLEQRKMLEREVPNAARELDRLHAATQYCWPPGPYPSPHPLCQTAYRMLQEMRVVPLQERLALQAQLWALLPRLWAEIARLDVQRWYHLQRPTSTDVVALAGG